MKYTKKQIQKAFEKWQEIERLEPETIQSKESLLSVNAKQVAKEQTETLLSFIKKK